MVASPPRLGVSLLVLVQALAGCSGSGTPGPTDTEEAPAPSVPGLEPGLALHNATFDWPAGTSAAEFTGTMPAQQYNVCTTECSGDALHDLSHLFPGAGIYRVWANLSWDGAADALGPLGGYQLNVFVEVEDGLYLDSDTERGAGTATQVLLLSRVAASGIQAHVQRWNPGASPATPYTLQVTVQSVRDDLAVGAPLGVEVPAGTTALAFTATGIGKDARVRVWTPDDAYLGTFELEAGVTTVPLRQAGEHVLQALAADGLKVQSVGPDASSAPLIRALGVERVFGEAHPVPPTGPAEWSFDVATPPLWAGLYIQATTATYSTQMGGMELASPAGTIVEAAWQCGLCQGTTTIGSAFGDAKLVPGTYTARAEWVLTEDAEVGEYLALHVR